MLTLSTFTDTLQLRTKKVICEHEVHVTKIDKIYKPNYISLKWLIHKEKMDMCRVQLNNSNFLIYFVLFRNCNTKRDIARIQR